MPCPFSSKADIRIPSNAERLKTWMRKEIPCVPGKREFSSGRYFIAEIHDPRSMAEAYERFVLTLRRRQTVAGLFVVSEQISLDHEASARDQLRQCAELMREVSDVPPEALVNGGRLGKTVDLDCPVTGVGRSFDDFDAVAFVPRSLDEGDPLYDPMMGAPVSCINFSSDIYAFAMFTRDTALRLKKSEVSKLDAEDRREFFAYAFQQWQRFARTTIQNYMSITNAEKYPVSLADDGSVWHASHQDPAFAESRKQQYAHHMPLLYVPRIVSAWETFFETGHIEKQSVETVTPFGCLSLLQSDRGLRL